MHLKGTFFVFKSDRKIKSVQKFLFLSFADFWKCKSVHMDVGGGWWESNEVKHRTYNQVQRKELELRK